MIKEMLNCLIGGINWSYYTPLVLNFIKDISWPAVTLIVVVYYRKQITYLLQRMESFEGLGTKWKVRGENAAPELSGTQFAESSGNAAKQAAADLAFLLSKYQFVWGAWIMGQEFCHAVRFSEKYSGGELRYLNDLSAALKKYQSENGTQLPEKVKALLSGLVSFIDEVLPYHQEKELLTRPAFSLPKYQELLRDLIRQIKTL